MLIQIDRKLAIKLIFSFLFCSISALAFDPVDYAETLAEDQIRHGNFDAAIGVVNFELQRNPKHPGLQTLRNSIIKQKAKALITEAEGHLKKRKYSDAKEAALQAAEADPNCGYHAVLDPAEIGLKAEAEEKRKHQMRLASERAAAEKARVAKLERERLEQEVAAKARAEQWERERPAREAAEKARAELWAREEPARAAAARAIAEERRASAASDNSKALPSQSTQGETNYRLLYQQDKASGGAGEAWSKSYEEQNKALKQNARTPAEYQHYQQEEQKAHYFNEQIQNEKKKDSWW